MRPRGELMAIEWFPIQHKALPIGIVQIRRRTRYGAGESRGKAGSEIVFPSATARAWNLDKFRFVQVGLSDGQGAQRAAVLFSTSGSGERRVVRCKPVVRVSATALVERTGCPDGLYLATRDMTNPNLVWITLSPLNERQVDARRGRQVGNARGEEDAD